MKFNAQVMIGNRVTIPREIVDKLGIKRGDFVSVDLALLEFREKAE